MATVINREHLKKLRATEDADGVCVEPQTAPPDAANLGIRGDHYLEALFVYSAI